MILPTPPTGPSAGTLRLVVRLAALASVFAFIAGVVWLLAGAIPVVGAGFIAVAAASFFGAVALHKPPNRPVLVGSGLRWAGLLMAAGGAIAAAIIHLQTGGRDLSFVIVVGVAWIGLAIQALAADERGRPGPILVQIVGLTLIVAWAGRIVPGMFNGYADQVALESLARQLALTGRLEGGDLYASFPTWHILSATLALASGVSMATASTIAVSAFSVVYLLAAYALARLATASISIALIATILLACLADTIQWSTMLTATSIGAALTVALTLLILVRRGGAPAHLLVLGGTALLVVSHHFSSAIYVVVLAAFIAGRGRAGRRSTRLQASLLLTTGVLIVAYWTYVSQGTFRVVVQQLERSIGEPFSQTVAIVSRGATAPVPGALPPELLAIIPRLPYFMLGIPFVVGVLIVVVRPSFVPRLSRLLVLPGILLFLVIAASFVPATVVGGAIFDRWRTFVAPYAVVIAALGLSMLPLGRMRAVAIVAAIAVIAVSSSVSAIIETDFVPGLAYGTPRPQYQPGELAALDYTLDKRTYPVRTDFITSRVLEIWSAGTADVSGTINRAQAASPGWYEVRRSAELATRGLRYVSGESSPISRDLLVTAEGYQAMRAGRQDVVFDGGSAQVIWTAQ
jgi:hypothetical protein